MTQTGLEDRIVDESVRARTEALFRQQGIVLPTLAQLADPATLPVPADLGTVDPDAPDLRNLLRVHWFNDASRRGRAEVPAHVVLPTALTGVPSPILVLYGNRFPMIRAHKVLAAYACLVPRLLSGQFDPTRHRAVWPSTGNYCRGGVAISRLLGCRGVAVLPEGMSAERFAWLERWVNQPEDIVRTVGTESNVKEIYDKCAELACDPQNFIFNQFAEYANHLVHYLCTGRALEQAFLHYRSQVDGGAPPRLAAFVSATGSAGTLAAGDYLKEQHGARIVAAEALECPTMLYNGYGEHNIQGIGDKHVPLVQNVMNMDLVSGISDRSTDVLNVLFNTDVGREVVRRERGVSGLLDELANFGLSSLCNVLAAIRSARVLKLGATDVVVTVATDGAEMYASELEKARERLFPHGFDADAAARILDRELGTPTTEHTHELTDVDRTRIFNLGYYTWVEQQGVTLEDFDRRRSQDFWRGLRAYLPVWDEMITQLNGATAPRASASPPPA